ncbi:MAG: carbohydrate-binding family 9-like protein [Fimbriimonadaceae bacterium]
MLIARRAPVPPNLDGLLDGSSWTLAPRSRDFVDMATGGPALYRTETAVLWDDENLYVGFWIEEPFPTAELTERDSLIFRENDVELFINGGDCYYEFEINALGTIYEVFFIWRDAFDRFDGFDLKDAYSFGGDFDRTPEHFWDGNHPRGTRWAFRNWDMPGLRSAVSVQGALNDSSVRSEGWRVEMAIPWESLRVLSNGREVPPKPGDVWNLFFGRFQRVPIGGVEHQAAWCVSPHGRYDTHMPERFTPVVFEG